MMIEGLNEEATSYCSCQLAALRFVLQEVASDYHGFPCSIGISNKSFTTGFEQRNPFFAGNRLLLSIDG